MWLGIIYTFACVQLTIIPKASCRMLNYRLFQKFKLLENCEFNQLTVTPSSNSLQTFGIELLEYVREKTPWETHWLYYFFLID